MLIEPQDYETVIEEQAKVIELLTADVEKYIRVLAYASNKPGLQEQLYVAEKYYGQFTDMMNLWEMVDHCKIDLSDAHYKQVNTAMRLFYGIQCHREPEEHSVYLEDGEKVCSVLYPTDMLPVLRHVLYAMGFE